MWVLFNKKVSRHDIYGVDVPIFELASQISKNNLRPSLEFEASNEVKQLMQRYSKPLHSCYQSMEWVSRGETNSDRNAEINPLSFVTTLLE